MDLPSDSLGDPDDPKIKVTRKAAFMAMLKATEEEADREGWVTADEVMEAMDAIIARAEQRAALKSRREMPKLRIFNAK